jgi:hypothetical protein
MIDAKTMRGNAENCFELAETASHLPTKTRYMRMATAWLDLAESQDWLDGVLKRSPPTQPFFDNAA